MWTTVLLVIHLMIAVALVAVVLLQRSEGCALGMGGGGGGFLTGRGTANLLTRTTAILAACFFLTSLGLTILANQGARTPSVFDRLSTTPPAASGAAAPKTDGQPAPQAPAGQTQAPAGRGGILDKIQPPTAPSGPVVPQSK